MLEIYADGACDPNPGVGGWGIAVYQDNVEVWSESGGELESTNNRMELKAVIEALKMAGGQPCRIYSDSKLVVNTLNTWARSWAQRGWRKADGQVPKNLELVKEAYALFRAGKARVQWIKGHAGNVGNERADELAREGRDSVGHPDWEEATA